MDILEKYEMALLQLLEYSDNEMVVQNGKEFEVKLELSKIQDQREALENKGSQK